MGFSAEVPVFVDTNLGTRIAMSISPEITARDLKRKLEDEHSICFPDIGKISIHGLMVKTKSNFYHLPDSMPIKNVFQGVKGAWFLQIDTTSVICSNKCWPSGDLKDSALYVSDVIDSQKPEDSTNCTIMMDSNENVVRSKRRMPTSLEDVMKDLLSPVTVAKDLKDSALYGSDVSDSQKPEDSTNCTIMMDSNENAVRSKRRMPNSLEDVMKDLLSPVNVAKDLKDSALYGSDVTDSQKPEDSTNCTIMMDYNESAVRSKRKMPTSLEDVMKELLSPVNVSKDLKDSALYGSDVNDSQKPEDSTNCTIMKDSNENAGRSKRKTPTSLEDLMKKLLSAANVPKEKKKKKKTTEIHLPVKCLDGSKERFLDKNEENEEVVSSQGRLCQFNSLKKKKKKKKEKENKNKKMELSPNTSDVVSVTGIIIRYFPEFDEVKSYKGSSECESNNICETTHQADGNGNGTLKYNAVRNYCSESETLDERVPLDAPVPLPTNPNPKTPRGNAGPSKATKPQSSKVSSIPIPRASRRAKLGSSKTEQLLPPKTPSSLPLPTSPSPRTSRDKKLGRSEVGKRLIQAANDLGISTVKKKQPPISLKLSSNLVRKLTFDISDSDD